jgi:hypothetical protein
VLTEHGYLTRANIIVSIVALAVLAAGLALRLSEAIPLVIVLLGVK